ncbi:hypothetical protein HK099_005991 [Clydaea vesicula]|uniref:Uncharacterized protein n=1 Tax=Clydaea vesicula TaxID=447962 RepID=A0AAD5U0E4_9FUNG|nr:hypothetical protein HK099_005991 [Clydaea vesicula]
MELIDQVHGLILTCRNLQLEIDKIKATQNPKDLSKLNSILNKLLQNPNSIKRIHIVSSNIPYLAAVISVIRNETGVISVFQKFLRSSKKLSKKDIISVDVISNYGRKWIKVKAANVKNIKKNLLYDFIEEETESNEFFLVNSDEEECDFITSKDESDDVKLIRQLKDMVTVSEKNLVHYVAPAVVVIFRVDNEDSIKSLEDADTLINNDEIINKFREIGVGAEVLVTSNEVFCCKKVLCLGKTVLTDDKKGESNEKIDQLSNTLLLDITTLIALCSNLSYKNSFTYDTKFKNECLQYQLIQELQSPLIIDLKKIFHGRKLITTKSVVKKLFSIVSTVGGKTERYRSKKIFKFEELKDYGLVETEVKDNKVFLEQDLDFLTQKSVEILENLNISIVNDEPSKKFELILKKKKNFKKKKNSNIPKIVKDFNLIIFGTAEFYKATIVTANKNFVKTLKNIPYEDLVDDNEEHAVDLKIFNCSYYLHESRSFVEQSEQFL